LLPLRSPLLRIIITIIIITTIITIITPRTKLGAQIAPGLAAPHICWQHESMVRFQP